MNLHEQTRQILKRRVDDYIQCDDYTTISQQQFAGDMSDTAFLAEMSSRLFTINKNSNQSFTLSEIIQIVPLCSRKDLIDFKDKKVTLNQLKATILKQIAKKNGQPVEFVTLDDIQQTLGDDRMGSKTLLGQYLKERRSQFKPGDAPSEYYDAEKLAKVETVPKSRKCLKSLTSHPTHKKRVHSAAAFGRTPATKSKKRDCSQFSTHLTGVKQAPTSSLEKHPTDNLNDVLFLRQLQNDGQVMISKEMEDMFVYHEAKQQEEDRRVKADKFIGKIQNKPRPQMIIKGHVRVGDKGNEFMLSADELVPAELLDLVQNKLNLKPKPTQASSPIKKKQLSIHELSEISLRRSSHEHQRLFSYVNQLLKDRKSKHAQTSSTVKSLQRQKPIQHLLILTLVLNAKRRLFAN